MTDIEYGECEMKLLFAFLMFLAWAGCTLYIGVWLYFAPLRWEWLEGTPQVFLTITLLLTSAITYAFAANRLFEKAE